MPGQLGPRHAPDDLPVGVMNVALDVHGPESASVVVAQVLQQLVRDAVVVESQEHQVAERGHGLVELGTAVDGEVVAEIVLDVTVTLHPDRASSPSLASLLLPCPLKSIFCQEVRRLFSRVTELSNGFLFQPKLNSYHDLQDRI